MESPRPRPPASHGSRWRLRDVIKAWEVISWTRCWALSPLPLPPAVLLWKTRVASPQNKPASKHSTVSWTLAWGGGVRGAQGRRQLPSTLDPPSCRPCRPLAGCTRRWSLPRSPRAGDWLRPLAQGGSADHVLKTKLRKGESLQYVLHKRSRSTVQRCQGAGCWYVGVRHTLLPGGHTLWGSVNRQPPRSGQ